MTVPAPKWDNRYAFRSLLADPVLDRRASSRTDAVGHEAAVLELAERVADGPGTQSGGDPLLGRPSYRGTCRRVSGAGRELEMALGCRLVRRFARPRSSLWFIQPRRARNPISVALMRIDRWGQRAMGPKTVRQGDPTEAACGNQTSYIDQLIETGLLASRRRRQAAGPSCFILTRAYRCESHIRYRQFKIAGRN